MWYNAKEPPFQWPASGNLDGSWAAGCREDETEQGQSLPPVEGIS